MPRYCYGTVWTIGNAKKRNIHTTQTDKSGNFEVVDQYLHKIRGFGNWIPESATSSLLSARGIATFRGM